MHSPEPSRKRFFTIFFTKRNLTNKRPCLFQQIAVRRPLKRLRKRAIIWMPKLKTSRTFEPFIASARAFCWSLPLLLFACATATGPSHSAGRGEHSQTVYVVHHGTLHTGLTLKRSDIPRGLWPASRDYVNDTYIEVGWGDDDGYRKPLTSGIAMKALMGSKRTVLLANGFSRTIRAKYNDPRFTALAVDLSPAGFARLCQHIQQTHAVDAAGQPIRLGEGWYRARGTYSAFNTCNTWVAAGLRKAGCPISPALCLMPGQLLGRVRPFARVISAKH
jgi:Protein of unknown function (DUF2459)